jgi:putative DNA primase/helicase
MGKDFFTFLPKFKLLIAGNHKPALRNIDEAIRRRFHLIPFTVTVPKEERDPELFSKLKGEAEGIMQWIVNGAVEYFRMGLAPPACVVEATRQYFEDEDVMSDWLAECCDRGADYWEPTGLMFASWKAYAEKANIRAGDAKALASKLTSAGFEPKRASSRGGRYWSGVRLKLEAAPDDPRYGR